VWGVFYFLILQVSVETGRGTIAGRYLRTENAGRYDTCKRELFESVYRLCFFCNDFVMFGEGSVDGARGERC
jgi:hypothetical protein